MEKWSTFQITNCQWFVSKQGYDTAAEWNTFLGTSEVDSTNLGTSAYPFRTRNAASEWVDTVSGDNVALGVGVWGTDYKRPSWTKLLHNYGIDNQHTIIDCQAATSGAQLAVSDQKLVEFYDITFIRGQYGAMYHNGGTSNNFNGGTLVRCVVDFLWFRGSGSYPVKGEYRFYDTCIEEIFHTTFYFTARMYLYSSTLLKNSIGSGYVIAVDSIVPAAGNNTYCCITIPNTTLGIGSFNGDPKFNNPENGDFTLRYDSPCIYRGYKNSTIGCYNLAYSFTPNSHQFTEQGGAIFSKNASNENQIERTTKEVMGKTLTIFKLIGGENYGNVESEWFDFQELQYILVPHVFANLLYDSNGVLSAASSANIDSERMSFQIKYCSEETEKDAAAWKDFIWNETMAIDGSGLGNADPNYDILSKKEIAARYIKIKLFMAKA